MGNAHRVYWLRFHESRRRSSHTPDSLDACAPATKARNAGAALERHPDTIGVRERAPSPLPDAVSHARRRGQAAELGVQPRIAEARMPEEQPARVTHRAVFAMKISRVRAALGRDLHTPLLRVS